VFDWRTQQRFAGKTKLEKAELEEMVLYRQSDPQRSFYAFCQDFRLPPSAPAATFGTAPHDTHTAHTTHDTHTHTTAHTAHDTHDTHGTHGMVGEGERAAKTTEASARETTATAPSTPPAAEPKPEGPQGQGRGRAQASRGKPGGGRPRASAAHEKLEREKPSDDSIVRRWRRNDLKKVRPWYRTIYEEWVQEQEYDREHRANAASSASALAAYYDE
jgi:hypothetical protein